jgi:hypothetical protein
MAEWIRKLWADGRNVLEGTKPVDLKPVRYKLLLELELEGELNMADPTLNVSITVNPAATPLVITDVNGNVLADGASIVLTAETINVADPGQMVFKVSGGVAPYQYLVSSGALPPGDQLNTTINPDTSETVTLSGTPTQLGTSTFALLITDSSLPTPARRTLAVTTKKIA